MGMFDRNKTQDQASSTAIDEKMPDGYDDEESPFFVHPDLRPFFKPTAMGVTNPTRAMHAIADARAQEVAAQRHPIPERPGSQTAMEYQDHVGRALEDRERFAAEETSRIFETEYDSLREQVAHATRLETAAKGYKAAEQRKVTAEHARALFECPVCGVQDRDNGAVAVRSLLPGFVMLRAMPILRSFRSCLLCHAVAAAQLVEEAGDAICKADLSRSIAVAAALDRHRLNSGEARS